MKTHSTNYFNTLIEIAEDSTSLVGVNPPTKGNKKTIATIQFEILYNNPYKYTSDEVLFDIHVFKKEILKADIEIEKQLFFSKGQPCFRASPLTKTYGWGVHSNNEGKIAIFAAGSSKYNQLLEDDTVRKVKAMRNKKKR